MQGKPALLDYSWSESKVIFLSKHPSKKWTSIFRQSEDRLAVRIISVANLLYSIRHSQVHCLSALSWNYLFNPNRDCLFSQKSFQGWRAQDSCPIVGYCEVSTWLSFTIIYLMFASVPAGTVFLRSLCMPTENLAWRLRNGCRWGHVLHQRKRRRRNQ